MVVERLCELAQSGNESAIYYAWECAVKLAELDLAAQRHAFHHTISDDFADSHCGRERREYRAQLLFISVDGGRSSQPRFDSEHVASRKHWPSGF